MKNPQPHYIIVEPENKTIYESFDFYDAFGEWKILKGQGLKVALYREQLSYTLLASFEGNDGTVRKQEA